MVIFQPVSQAPNQLDLFIGRPDDLRGVMAATSLLDLRVLPSSRLEADQRPAMNRSIRSNACSSSGVEAAKQRRT
jgi:hypothetical protein